jgi:hypothetical protein
MDLLSEIHQVNRSILLVDGKAFDFLIVNTVDVAFIGFPGVINCRSVFLDLLGTSRICESSPH